MSAAKNTGDYIPDDFEHEIGTIYMVKDKGLVVLTSCSHRGVINAVRQARLRLLQWRLGDLVCPRALPKKSSLWPP